MIVIRSSAAFILETRIDKRNLRQLASGGIGQELLEGKANLDTSLPRVPGTAYHHNNNDQTVRVH